MLKKTIFICAITFWIFHPLACDEQEDDPTEDFTELSLTVCDPEPGALTTEITNPYFPLPVGRQLVLEGMDDGTQIRVEMTVLNETEAVAGVQTRVVEEAEYEDGALIEMSRNFFAQAADGTVCYFGEDVDDYKNGAVVGHGGAWRAGVGENRPGIIMPGNPVPETKFYQEYAPGIAEDMSAIVGFEESFSVLVGDYTNVLHAIDWNPLEGDNGADAEDKYYAPHIGLIVDDVVELVSYKE